VLAADGRGYTWGMAIEYYHDDWAFRFGHFAQPIHSNGMAIDFKLYEHFGDNIEVEHDHTLWGLAGKIRLLGFLNYARMAAFDDALAYAQRHGGTPDIANVRKDQSKVGFGISAEQYLTRDLGIFGRFSWNDGRTETYAFAEIDSSLTVGAALQGRLWLRPDDTIGLAFIQNGIADPRRDYLEAGGLATFIGDGRLNYAPERIIETYYSLRAFWGLWLSAGLEYIWNPAYNADRGPVIFYSGRAHFEY
jgi:carbohydrate-selective porin OprB